MEELLIYLFKVIALQTILFLIYWFASRKTSNFQFNRFFLLSILILPFVLPFVKLPLILSTSEVLPIIGEELFMLQEVSTQTLNTQAITTSASGSHWWINALLLIYLVILSLMTFKLINGFRNIRRLSRQSDRVELTSSGYLVHFIPSKILSFSFFRKIFISTYYEFQPREKSSIITHEEFHIRHLHSLDILITEVIRIICWFNPVIYLIQQQLKEVHEYEADQHVCKSANTKAYITFLRSHQWQTYNLILGHSISGSSIANRINMMKRLNQTPKFLQNLATTVLAVVICFFMACEDKLEPMDLQADEGFQYEFSDADLEKEIEMNLKMSLRNAPQDLINLYVEKQRAYPEYRYTPSIRTKTSLMPEKVIESFKKDHKFTSDVTWEVIYFRELNSAEVSELEKSIHLELTNDRLKEVYKDIRAFACIRKVDRYKYMEYKYKTEGDNSIHDDVDKSPRFKGGSAGLHRYLKENLKYPEIAKRYEIEDKVILRFVVTKRGGLLYLNIDKRPTTNNEEVSIELEKAAFFAISNTRGMWEPAEKDGRYVLSKVTLPIEFKLEE